MRGTVQMRLECFAVTHSVPFGKVWRCRTSHRQLTGLASLFSLSSYRYMLHWNWTLELDIDPMRPVTTYWLVKLIPPPLHNLNRSYILLPSLDPIHHQADDKYTHEDNNAPVECISGRRCLAGPE